MGDNIVLGIIIAMMALFYCRSTRCDYVYDDADPEVCAWVDDALTEACESAGTPADSTLYALVLPSKEAQPW